MLRGKFVTTYKGITGDSNVLELLHPSLTLLIRERGGDLLEDGLKGVAFSTILGKLPTDQEVDGVTLVCSLGALLPLEAEDSLVEAHPPVVGLVTGQTGAVNAGLLASTEADDLAVDGVAHRVALGVLESDGSDSEIPGRTL
jgi:hypothetical protein